MCSTGPPAPSHAQHTPCDVWVLVTSSYNHLVLQSAQGRRHKQLQVVCASHLYRGLPQSCPVSLNASGGTPDTSSGAHVCSFSSNRCLQQQQQESRRQLLLGVLHDATHAWSPTAATAHWSGSTAETPSCCLVQCSCCRHRPAQSPHEHIAENNAAALIMHQP